MGHVDVNGVGFFLPDGRQLLRDIAFRVGEGAKVALVGANGAGKTTLLKIIASDLDPHEGSVGRSGGLGVMRQFVGSVRDSSTVRDLLASVAPPAVRAAATALEASELAMMEHDDEKTQLRYAQALADWADAGGYDAEVLWDTCTVAALGVPFEKAQWREVRTLSGGEQKRVVLEALLRGPDEVLMLDEPDNYLDVPGKRWLEQSLRESPKTVLFVSHDRELLSHTATRVVTVELGAAGNTVWTHGGGFATYHQARRDRFSRLEELRRRWDEERAKLKALVLMYKQKAAYNDGMASRYQAAQTRLRMFDEAGPPEAIPQEQNVKMRLRGARTGKRAIVCTDLELTGLMKPFDLEVWYGDRVAVLGSNGSGKSHFLRLLAVGGSDPDNEHRPVEDVVIAPVAHTGRARPRGPGAARLVRADARAPRADRSHPARHPVARRRAAWGHGSRGGVAGRSTAMSSRTQPSSRSSRSRAASRPACRSCCSSCPGRRCCCSTSRRTTSTWSPPRRWRRASRRSTARSSP